MGDLDRFDPLDGAARAEAAKIIRESRISYAVKDGTPVTIKLSGDLTPDTTDWSVIFGAEAELISQLPEAALQRRAPLIYERYANVAGAEKAASRAANTLDLKTCGVDLLRADLLAVHNETARLYMTNYQVERQRTELAWFVTRIGIVALGVFVAFIGWPFLLRGLQEKKLDSCTIGLVYALVMLILVYVAIRFRRWLATRRPSGIAAAFVLLVVLTASAQAQETATVPPVTTSSADATSTTTDDAAKQAAAKKADEEKKAAEATKAEDAAKADDAKKLEAQKKAAERRRAEEEAEDEEYRKLTNLPIVPLMLLAGILGATFSILQRVQRSTAADPLVALFNLRAARSQIYLSIVSGAIAALVVFAIFCGGMLEGGLFPTIVNRGSNGEGKSMMKLVEYLRGTGPRTHLDYGKLLVWGFIAGFAERFVPDILDKFTSSTKKA